MWGDDRYVGDLLGAWDYARNDPDGVLGGSLPASEVGLMGFSLGGFTTANAFGKEGEVPAAWIDGSLFRPDSVFDFAARQVMDSMGVGFLADLVLGAVWSALEYQAAGQGILWSQNLPEKNVPLGPDTQRPTYLVANTDDTTVPNAGPDSQFAKLLATFEAYPSKYDVVGTFLTSGECKDNDHCIDHLRAFDEYSSRLCNFWRPVFGLGVGTCP
jgi:dienelactone hydrolase